MGRFAVPAMWFFYRQKLRNKYQWQNLLMVRQNFSLKKPPFNPYAIVGISVSITMNKTIKQR